MTSSLIFETTRKILRNVSFAHVCNVHKKRKTCMTGKRRNADLNGGTVTRLQTAVGISYFDMTNWQHIALITITSFSFQLGLIVCSFVCHNIQFSLNWDCKNALRFDDRDGDRLFMACYASKQGEVIPQRCNVTLIRCSTNDNIWKYHQYIDVYRARLKSAPKVWWILFLLLFTTSASVCLQRSRNLEHAF